MTGDARAPANPQGARLHAERDPLRLDPGQRPPRPEDLAARGGKPFIVTTAANGRGPVHWRNARRRLMNVWCHPLKRGLGLPPTTATGHPLVDAFLWIGRPGYSGGSCNGGPLPVGAWRPARALMLAKYSTTWLSRPRGTRFACFAAIRSGRWRGTGIFDSGVNFA